jgi:hypothetical protein
VVMEELARGAGIAALPHGSSRALTKSLVTLEDERRHLSADIRLIHRSQTTDNLMRQLAAFIAEENLLLLPIVLS